MNLDLKPEGRGLEGTEKLGPLSPSFGRVRKPGQAHRPVYVRESSSSPADVRDTWTGFWKISSGLRRSPSLP